VVVKEWLFMEKGQLRMVVVALINFRSMNLKESVTIVAK
jgi:hypothetical protein